MKVLQPERLALTTYDISFDALYEEGIRGIIFDIDNTLVLPDMPADERSCRLTAELISMGFKVCLVSNNREERIRPFAEALGVPFVAKALKPRNYGYLKAMEIMGTRPSETVSIGDQIFTDIWGANRLGIHTILTRPMTDNEEIQIRIKRLFEGPVISSYLKEQRKKARKRKKNVK